MNKSKSKSKRPINAIYERVRTQDGSFGIELNLHPGQQKAWDSTRRIVAIMAGTQSGKTSFLPWLLHREIERNRDTLPGIPQDYLAVTANYDLFKLKFLPTLREVFETLTKSGRYWSSTKVIELQNPITGKFEANRADDPMWGRVILRSADSPSGLESATVRAVLLDEAGMNSFTLETKEAIDRRLSLSEGRIFIGTTIYNLGWLKSEIYDRWQAGDPEIDVIQFDSTQNPAFPKSSFDKARRTMPRWRFDMMYRGLFTRPAGQIYDVFSEARHTVPRFTIPNHWDRFIGLDFGSVNTAAIFLARKPGTRIHYLYRIYKSGSKTAKQHVSDMMLPDNLNTARFTCVGGSKSEEAWRLEYTDTGLVVTKPNIWDVEVGIERVYRLLANDELVIFNDLQPMIDDLTGYSRKVDTQGNTLDDIDDKSSYHYADALRYIATLLASAQVATGNHVSPPRLPIVLPQSSAQAMLKRVLPKIPGFR